MHTVRPFDQKLPWLLQMVRSTAASAQHVQLAAALQVDGNVSPMSRQGCPVDVQPAVF